MKQMDLVVTRSAKTAKLLGFVLAQLRFADALKASWEVMRVPAYQRAVVYGHASSECLKAGTTDLFPLYELLAADAQNANWPSPENTQDVTGCALRAYSQNAISKDERDYFIKRAFALPSAFPTSRNVRMDRFVEEKVRELSKELCLDKKRSSVRRTSIKMGSVYIPSVRQSNSGLKAVKKLVAELEQQLSPSER